MKSTKYCRVEDVEPKQAFQNIFLCSLETFEIKPHWTVKIIHGDHKRPKACYQITASSIDTQTIGKRTVTRVYEDGREVMMLPESCTAAQHFDTPEYTGYELRFDTVTMLWFFQTEEHPDYRWWADYENSKED